MKLREFFQTVYSPRRLTGVSKSTMRLYANTLNQFERFLKRDGTLEDFNDDMVSRFAGHRCKTVCAVSVNKELSQLRAIWNFACKKRYIDEWPDVRDLPELERTPTAWTVEQVGRIVQTCLANNHIFARETTCGIQPSRFMAALILLCYDTGLRIGAVMQIRQADVDIEQCTVYVAAETQKDKQDQVLKFSEQTAEILRSIWRPKRALLFPWHGHLSTRYYWLKRILKLANLPAGRRDLFQRLRRTCATLCKAGGVDATAQLGHSSDETTRKHYLAPTSELQASDVLPRPQITDAERPKAPEVKTIKAEPAVVKAVAAARSAKAKAPEIDFQN